MFLKVLFFAFLIKFTPKGGTITLTVAEAGDEVTVTVSDTGIGISKEDQGKLFTKFFRADAARRLETDGTGLGLFIVKSIIENTLQNQNYLFQLLNFPWCHDA